MAWKIRLRRNVPEGIAPGEGEPVLVESPEGWILKVGDNATPVEDLPVIAGPGAFAVVEETAQSVLQAAIDAESAAGASLTARDAALASQGAAADSAASVAVSAELIQQGVTVTDGALAAALANPASASRTALNATITGQFDAAIPSSLAAGVHENRVVVFGDSHTAATNDASPATPQNRQADYRYRAVGLQAKGLRPSIGVRANGGTFSWVAMQWTEGDTEGDHIVYMEATITQTGVTQVRLSVEPGPLGNADPAGGDLFIIGEVAVRRLT